MQINSDKVEFLTGSMAVLEGMKNIPALPVFSNQAVGFLNALSRMLMKDRRARRYTDVMSYAYWIRKASIEHIKGKYRDCEYRLGRGMAFHIAASNIPVNFAVSMTSSLLAGNGTVIRLSEKQFEQIDIICSCMNSLLNGDYRFLKPYFCIIRYGHDEEITQELSLVCDVRVIWGGDRTVEAIRRCPVGARTIELTFADRYSIAVINAEEYLGSDPVRVAKDFYTDTYYTDQNACSSPRLVVWLGNAVEEARERFWGELDKLVKQDYPMKEIQAVDKYVSLCRLGMIQGGARLLSNDNYVVRAEVERLTGELMNYKEAGGLFFEYVAKELGEIVPVASKRCQTVAVLGIPKEEVRNLVLTHGVRGIDRIVQLGDTMGLEFIWDGFNMIETMSRFVYCGNHA